MEKYFSLTWRNPGHWDVYTRESRLFRIRGGIKEGPSHWNGYYAISDERPEPAKKLHDWMHFKTFDAAMAWIVAELMTEPTPSEEK